MSNKRFVASQGYAFGQLERALRSVDPDPAKVDRWRAVLAGMADGTLTVGSRTPVAGTPSWVTLEVAHGGFATGRYLAEVELRDDELAVLPPGTPGTTPRERLNLWYLTDTGQATLLDAPATGNYRIEVARQLEPAVLGLRHVIAGGRFAADGTVASGGRRFLGWSAGPHWALGHLRL